MIELKEQKREKKGDGKFIEWRHHHRQMMTIDNYSRDRMFEQADFHRD